MGISVAFFNEDKYKEMRRNLHFLRTWRKEQKEFEFRKK